MNFNIAIEKTEKVADDIYLLRLRSEEITQQAVPGQFVNVRCSTGLDAYLRRPISICRVDRQNHTFDIVYMNRGRGTSLLCSFCAGDVLDAMGPLGKGFTLPKQGERIAVVGGGIGIFVAQVAADQPARCQRDGFLLQPEIGRDLLEALVEHVLDLPVARSEIGQHPVQFAAHAGWIEREDVGHQPLDPARALAVDAQRQMERPDHDPRRIGVEPQRMDPGGAHRSARQLAGASCWRGVQSVLPPAARAGLERGQRMGR